MSFILAYLDPGAGSILLQAIIAGVLGTAVVLKLFWRKLTKPFRKPSDEDETDDPTSDEDNKSD